MGRKRVLLFCDENIRDVDDDNAKEFCAIRAKGCRTDGVYLLYGAAVTNKCTKLSVIGMLNGELVIHMPDMLCNY